VEGNDMDRLTERLLDCQDCGHPHQREDGTYTPCPWPSCKGSAIGDKCWITSLREPDRHDRNLT
jgi:hypothetical protein